MEVLGRQVGDVGAAVRYLHRLDSMHDVPVLDLHGLVLLELVKDSLGNLLGRPVLGAQRPVVERDQGLLRRQDGGR